MTAANERFRCLRAAVPGAEAAGQLSPERLIGRVPRLPRFAGSFVRVPQDLQVTIETNEQGDTRIMTASNVT